MRTLVSSRDAETAGYRFVTARADGVVCCAANDTAHMCDECRLAIQAGRAAASGGAVPAVPDLADAIRRARGDGTQLERFARKRLSKSTDRLLEAVRDGSVNSHGVPNAPRLAARR